MSESDTALAQALMRWQSAAGPYWPYVCAAPFLAADDVLGHGGLLPARPGRARSTRDKEVSNAIGDWLACRNDEPVADGLQSARSGRQAAVFIDLPPARMLMLAPSLNRLGLIVVPVIQRWLVVRAVLPARRLAKRLAACSWWIVVPQTIRGVVFLLDGERFGASSANERRETALDPFDNRYEYPVCRFPPPEFLRLHGVDAVAWVSPDGITEDVEPYVDTLTASGFRPDDLRTGLSAA